MPVALFRIGSSCSWHLRWLGWLKSSQFCGDHRDATAPAKNTTLTSRAQAVIYSRAAELKKASMEGQAGWIGLDADVTFEVPCESDFDRHIDVTILI